MISGDRGVSSVQFLLAAALGLLVFLILANVVVVQYGRGAIRSALEQGARAGSIQGDTAVCVARVGEVLDQLLGGRMSDRLDAECVSSGTVMTASADAVFESWTPLLSDFQVELSTDALIEPPP